MDDELDDEQQDEQQQQQQDDERVCSLSPYEIGRAWLLRRFGRARTRRDLRLKKVKRCRRAVDGYACGWKLRHGPRGPARRQK